MISKEAKQLKRLEMRITKLTNLVNYLLTKKHETIEAQPINVRSQVLNNEYECYTYSMVTGDFIKKIRVTQLQIASAAAIPTGTKTFAFLVKGKYYMQVPVWL